MKKYRWTEKPFKKSVLAAVLVIGAGTLVFQGLTQAAAASVYDRAEVIPTSYADYPGPSSPTAGNTTPPGYIKANYTVENINRPYFENMQPAEKDITKEAAAELAAQYLWQLYGADLNDQKIQMGYNKPTENLPRSFWTADIFIKGQDVHADYTVNYYCVWIDSVTGEVLNIGQDRTLKKAVSLDFDLALDQNPEKYGAEYITAAKTLAENYQVVHSAVTSVKYMGQGYSGNDPIISFEIHGDNGEIALISLSKFDKSLGGISYYGDYKYTLLRIEKLEQEVKSSSGTGQELRLVPTDGQIPLQ